MIPPTIIWRHRKENLKKCSLRGLENRADIHFYLYPHTLFTPPSDYIFLTVGAPPLTEGDKDLGIFLIDATWNYAEKMHQCLHPPQNQCRSIPTTFRTAYPRKQTGCSDPDLGLASIEALYIAYRILRRPCADLLDSYYWKGEFLKKNGF